MTALWRALALAGVLTLLSSAGALAGNHHHRVARAHQHQVARADPRPARWCAWWLRRELGIPRAAFPAGRYNQARAFALIGRRAAGPAIGVIVVWRHHVGIITGGKRGAWRVKSGNDGHRVRERVRSLAGVVAFRWPPGRGRFSVAGDRARRFGIPAD